jgi:beta-fructofuranosidase
MEPQFITQPDQTTWAHDYHRPRYHFLPPYGWMNDPNGLIQIGSTFHLFYQHNPVQAAWGDMHWGHAISEDLVTWEHLPIALSPHEVGIDDGGCWSGGVIQKKKEIMLFYTAAPAEDKHDPFANRSVCLAVGTPDLVRWQKHPKNPVIPSLPSDSKLCAVRDPIVWQEDGQWYMTLGAGIRDVGGAVLLYRSNNLRQWEYMHTLCEDVIGEWGQLWECPQLIRFNARSLLLLNAWTENEMPYTIYSIGTYAQNRFIRRRTKPLDLSSSYFYAPQSLRDDQTRQIMWGWVREGRSETHQLAAGWSGVMSLPRVVRIEDETHLRVDPAPELLALRDQLLTSLRDQPLARNHNQHIEHVSGHLLEIFAQFEVRDAEQVGMTICASADATEYTRILFDPTHEELIIDRSHANATDDDGIDRFEHRGALRLGEDRVLTLHIFIDHSVIEIFLNEGRARVVTRVYASRADSTHVGIFNQGDVTLRAFDAWSLNSIWD